jgi:Annelid erythrocruorin linker subunit C-terminus
MATFFVEFNDGRRDAPYSYVANGYFVYGTRQLVLTGPHAEGSSAVNVIICHFNRGNNDQAKCSLVLESTQQECAVFRLDRV